MGQLASARHDKRLIFVAAGAAQKAEDFVLELATSDVACKLVTRNECI